MTTYYYPRGFISRYSDNASNNTGDHYFTKGSSAIEGLVKGMTNRSKDIDYAKEAITAANNHFGELLNFIRFNCNCSKMLSTMGTESLLLLLECIDDDIDISDTLATRKLYMPVYETRKGAVCNKTFDTISQLIEKSKDERGHTYYTTATLIRHIIKNSNDGIVGLVKVLDFFFGYERADDSAEKILAAAIAMKTINQAKPVLL